MLIVGLGNPGSEYEQTRHNIGFMVIDELRSRHSNSSISKASFEGELFKFNTHYLLKPTTYMNLSGNSIVTVKNFYKIEDVIVIHDDLDLPFGTLRFKHAGGHGGHNGLRSADSTITKEYLRVRMGIGKPEHKGEVSSYVLGNFSEEQRKHLDEWIKKCADAVELLLENDWEKVASLHSIKKFQL
ncbi:MAG: aminoacyl-tRNA hydrolase [Helicobacteraceae bacterium]|nr:aminoacyl-tRNA hydrolase [Helicobacteraceae bacterium]